MGRGAVLGFCLRGACRKMHVPLVGRNENTIQTPYNQVCGFHTKPFKSSLPLTGHLPKTMSLCTFRARLVTFSLSRCLVRRVCVCRFVFLDGGACSSALENGSLMSTFWFLLWLSELTLNFDSSGWSEWGLHEGVYPLASDCPKSVHPQRMRLA